MGQPEECHQSHSGQLRPKPHACLSQLAYEARIVKSCGGCTVSRSLLRLVATVSSWQRLRNVDHGSILLKQLGFISIPDLLRIVYRSLLSWQFGVAVVLLMMFFVRTN